MILGNPDIIAIEYADIWRSDRGYLFGRIRLVAKNIAIGNFEQYVMMGTVVLFMNDFISFQGKRFHEELIGKDDRECIEWVWLLLYEIGVSDPVVRNVYEQIVFCPKVSPSFDGDTAILIEEDEHSRFIFQPFRSNSVDSVTFERFYLHDLIKQFLQVVSTQPG